MRMLVFGDSVAQGYYDMERSGWVQRLFIDVMLKKVCNPANDVEVFNMSVSGNLTRHVIARLRAEAKARTWGDEEIAFVFAVGLNDSVISSTDEQSSPEQYVYELTELFHIARQLSGKIMFIGLTPVDETLTTPWKYNSGSQNLFWQNTRIAQFDTALQQWARGHDVIYVPIRPAFARQSQAGAAELLADGLHPNAAGHDLMFATIAPVIREQWQL